MLSPYSHGSPGHHPVTLVQQRETSWGWKWGPHWGVCVCTRVCEHTHMCAAQMDSNSNTFKSLFLQHSLQQRVEAINTLVPGQK